jgi:hypothetical protein
MSPIEKARREAVAELLLTGVQPEEIAAVLGVSLAHVVEDAKVCRGELLRRVANSETVEEAAIQAERYDLLFSSALLAARQSSTLRQQTESLRLALSVLHDKTSFLTTTGLLPCRTSEVDLRLLGRQAEVRAPRGEFAELLADPVRRRQVVSFTENLLRTVGDTDSAALAAALDALDMADEDTSREESATSGLLPPK